MKLRIQPVKFARIYVTDILNIYFSLHLNGTMNGVSTDFIETIAEGLGITATKEALRSLSLDVEYKIRDIIQVRYAITFVDVCFNATGASDCDCLLSLFSTRIRLPGNREDPQSTQTMLIMHLETLMWRYVATDNLFLCPAKCFKEACFLQPMYGLTNTSDPFRFVKLSGHAQVLRVRDPVVPLDAVLQKPLPSPPWEAGCRIHWLAIDGKQPNIPENVAMLRPTRRPKRRKTDILALEPEKRANIEVDAATTTAPQDGQAAQDALKAENLQQAPGGVLIKAPLKHVLSKELNLYLDRVISVLDGVCPSGIDRTNLLDATLSSLRLDAGLQPLAPYLCHTFAEKIWVECGWDTSTKQKTSKRYDPQKLNAYLRASECIASNRTLDLSWYLHELIPAIMDTILDIPSVHIDNKKKKDEKLRELNRKYRWDQREFGARALASMCVWYPEVGPRVQKQFVQTLKSNPESHAPAIFGAIVGLGCQGERAVQTLLLPHMLPMLRNIMLHARACSAAELYIIRNTLLETAGTFLCRRTMSSKPPPPTYPHTKRPGEIFSGEAATMPSTASHYGDRNNSKGNIAFNETDEDPCLSFCESPDSVAASTAWLKQFCTKGKMHSMSGKKDEAYYPIISMKTDGKSEMKHQVGSSNPAKCIEQLEVFPAQISTSDAKMLAKAYAEEPRAEESLRILHSTFGVSSDPFVQRSMHDCYFL